MRKLALALATACLLVCGIAASPWLHGLAVNLMLGANCPSELLEVAKQRNQQLFGPLQSQPRISCLAEPEVLGLSVSHGTARIIPLLPTIILIGPQGVNADVMAHEWAHAEIAQRVGAWRRLRAMPIWFDEGLAMQLDERPDYSAAALTHYGQDPELTKPRLHEIATVDGFFNPSSQGKLHYALARCVLAHWRHHITDMSADVSAQLQQFNKLTPEQPEFQRAADACLSRSRSPVDTN